MSDIWWDAYNLFHGGEFATFWGKHLDGGNRRLLYILGAGFDPRVLGPVRTITEAAPAVEPRCMAIDMSDGYGTDETARSLGGRKRAGLVKLFGEDRLELRRLVPTDADGICDVSRNTAILFQDIADWVGSYTDIAVDISALPRLVYLITLNMLLKHLVNLDSTPPLGSNVNLHVVYAEAPAIDAAIVKYEIDTELAPIQNLGIRLDEEASLSWPVVWFPVLAEDVLEQLTRIGDRTNPNEIWPVLPAQSLNARRADNIVRALGELLFDRYDVDNRDVIRATEWNPFQLYRSLSAAMARYEESLKLFGGARFVLSPLSSKGLSIGCLLAVFEKRATGNPSTVRIGLAHVESRRYDAARLPNAPSYELISAWLTGECYQRTAQRHVGAASE
jgi:hypothetical protein